MSLKIVIIGAGEVGYNLARELSEDDYEITVVENNPARAKRVAETLDVNTIEGNGASPLILHDADAGNADIFLALTRIDEVNLVSCMMAKELGAQKVIARLRNTEYTSPKSVMKPRQFGIDLVIHPELAAVNEVINLLKQSSARDVKEFADGQLQLVGVTLDASSPLNNHTIEDVTLAHKLIPHKVIAIKREGENFVPTGDTFFMAGDIAYFLAETRHMESVLTMLGKPSRKLKKIMILGAGKIGRRLAAKLQDDIDVRLVDRDKAKAWDAAPKLIDTLVLHGDGTDIEFLMSENISEMDSFIAVTEDEQTNLLTGLLAKHLGVPHVIVHLGTSDFLPIARRIGIDSVISKNLATVEVILASIKSTRDLSVIRFEDVDLEVVEIETERDSKVTKHLVKDLKLPPGLILGAIIRDNRVELPMGNTQIHEGDRVLVFVKNEQISKVEKFFT